MQSIRGDKGGQYSGADVRMGGGDLDAATDAWPHIRRSLLLRDSSYLPQSQKYLPHGQKVFSIQPPNLIMLAKNDICYNREFERPLIHHHASPCKYKTPVDNNMISALT